MSTILRNLPIESVNSMEESDFTEVFGNVVEKYPQAAQAVSVMRPFQHRDALIDALSSYLDSLDREEKKVILTMHPDLAGKGELTKESSEEQKAAGLGDLTADDKKKIKHFNSKYKEKFGFPFVICARENKVAAILEGIQSRLDNTWEEELVTGINEVKKICRLRVTDIVSE